MRLLPLWAILLAACCQAQPLPLAVHPFRTNTGFRLGLAWNASLDPLVDGYMRYYGTASRVYTNVLDVGLDASNTVSGLVRGRRYFFAVTDYDIGWWESDYSAELVFDVPPPATNSVVQVTGAHDISSDLSTWQTTFEDPWTRTNYPGPVWFRNPFQPPAITNWHY